MPLKLVGAVLVLAALIATALMLSFAGSPIQAQNATNTYDDPQPCGPNAGTAYQPEPHEIHAGHFALFDAYWYRIPPAQNQESGSVGNVGYLHTNQCPPKITKTTTTDDLGNQTTTTSLVASGIDIHEAIFHVLDEDKATVVEGDPDDEDSSHLWLLSFPEVEDYAEIGDHVWWLQLDDPNLTGDQSSDLKLGFSTKRLDGQFWANAGGGSAFRYELRLERNPGIDASEHPHLLAYRARLAGEVLGGELVWDSAKTGTTSLSMEPGQLNDLQWIFTKPGTYEIHVQLVGYVRQVNPYPESDSRHDDWEAISENITETSEVKRYVIQVGSDLAEVEPPQFGVGLSVMENPPAGTNVSDPITVFSEADDLEYSLSGDGSENFALVGATNPHTVQIKVAEGANLDYETKPVYDLTLEVTNNIDHESNPDPAIDDTLAVRVELEDEPGSAVIQVSNLNPVVGETVTFTGVVKEFGQGQELDYIFTDSQGRVAWEINTHTIRHDSPATETVQFEVAYEVQDGTSDSPVITLSAEPVTVTWSNP